MNHRTEEASRIKDPSLAADIPAAERAWWRITRPDLTRLGETVAGLEREIAELALSARA